VPDTPSLAKHHPYLLQGVLNFFMEQGKVALVASDDAATQAGFEAALEKQVQALLGCDIIRLQAHTDEDILKTFNNLLSQISLQQATQATAERQANYLLWVSENEHFTPERFHLLKNIILQFSGLQLKLLVSVTSDRWSGRLFDISGRKIAYWFIPSVGSLTPFSSVVSMPPDAAAASVATAEPSAESAATESNLVRDKSKPSPTAPVSPVNVSGGSSRPSGGNPNLWVPAVGLLVLVGAAAFWLQDRLPTAPTPTPAPPSQALAPDDVLPQSQTLTPADLASPPGPESSQPALPSPKTSAYPPADPAARPLAQASAMTASSPIKASESGASGTKLAANSSVAKTPDSANEALSTPEAPSAPKPEPASQIIVINTLADCPISAEANNLPTAKPVSYIKDTNYIFVKSKKSRKICVAPTGGPFRLLNLQANKGNSAFGTGPWRVFSPDLRQIELYFQGARVTLGPNVTDSVLIIPR